MRKLAWILSFMFILFVGASAAWAPCFISGYVYCDVNQNGIVDAAEDMPLANIQILAGGSPISPVDGEPPVTTDSDGYYEVLSHDVCGGTISLDETTLPDDAMFVNPSTNGVSPDVGTDWLIDSAICHPNPAIDIRKQEEGPDSRTFAYGAEVTFEIVVTNTGDVDLANVEVTDELAPSCDYAIGNLAVGESIIYECTIPYLTAGFENVACVSGQADGVVVTDCDPSTVVIEGGGQGCTPGYWKQNQHFDSWTAPLTPDTLFSDVFEDAFPGKTLLDVLTQGGGGLNALGRHTVAALLNAASPGVSYDLTVDSVIDMFNSANPDGDYETLKDLFEVFNEQGCPID